MIDANPENPGSRRRNAGIPVCSKIERRLGSRLSDLKPELEQFAVDARRSPERVLNAHPPDQRTEVNSICGRPPRERDFPTPVAAKARPMPTHQRLGTDDREDLQNRWNQSIQLDQEPAIVFVSRTRPCTLRRKTIN